VQFRSVDGKPAIIILNPIVSDSGKIVQKPGTEHLNIVIYWLDDRNLQRIWGRKYSIDEAHFSWRDRHGANEASRAMLSSDPGRPGGYFVWQPYRPGWIVLRAMLVPLGLGLLVTVLLIWSLGRRLVRSTAQLMASEAQARQLAFHDVLTGLPNRALFEDRLDRALGQSITSGRPATLLLLDLDRFKCVNDTLGHPAGDDLIREVARRLSGLIRKDDTAARLGGDEFAIILNGVNGRREINSFCRRVNKTLTAPFDLLGSQAFIGVSIGLARAPLDGSIGPNSPERPT
jgi:diguanylate cyclase (GGDEF)-like protein